jgi:hypothetical protein
MPCVWSVHVSEIKQRLFHAVVLNSSAAVKRRRWRVRRDVVIEVGRHAVLYKASNPNVSMLRFDKYTTQASMNRALHNYVFSNSTSCGELNLADKWGMETVNGNEYIRAHGLDIVANSVRHFLQKGTGTCIFTEGDMGKVTPVGIPSGNDLQNSLLDEFVARPDLLGVCEGVNNKVLSRECYMFVFVPDDDAVTADTSDAIPGASASSVPKISSKQAGKRRRIAEK